MLGLSYGTLVTICIGRLRRFMPRARNAVRGLAALVLAMGISASVPAADSGITTSHGFAAYGGMKYPPDFKHFDYVNPDAPKGGTVHFAQTGYSFDNLNNFAITSAAPFGMLWLYDRLMQRSLDEPAAQYGMLAETITYPKDMSWVEYKLRPEARWATGEPVLPEDVIFTVETFQTQGGPQYRRVGAAVKRVYKTGPLTVRMELVEKNNASLVAIVNELTVIPRAFFEGKDFIRGSMEVPYGSGPYEVEDLTPGRWIHLKLREDYWGKDLPVARGRFNMDMHYDVYRDGSVYKDAFLSGEYDFRTDRTAAKDWEYENGLDVVQRGDLKRATIPYATAVTYHSVVLNTRRKFLSDRNVRKALVHAYDFEWMRRNVLHGHHARLRSYYDNSEFDFEGLPTPGELELLEPWRDQLPPELFTQPFKLPVLGTRERQRTNLLEAQRLLLEAGYQYKDLRLVDPATDQPIELDLMLGYGIIYEKFITEFVQNLDRLGIAVNIKLYDTSTVRQLTARYEYDMRISLPNLPIRLTPGQEVINEFGSIGVNNLDSRNLSGVDEPVVDDMIRKMLTATNRDEVVNPLKAMNRVLTWGYYSIPLAHIYPAEIGKMPISYWDRFGRPAKEPLYYFPYFTLDHWWLDQEKSDAIDQRLGKSR